MNGFQHCGHDVRLRDGLLGFNDNRLIFIGLLQLFGGNKKMARHPLHDGEDALIANAALTQLGRNHGETRELPWIAAGNSCHATSIYISRRNIYPSLPLRVIDTPRLASSGRSRALAFPHLCSDYRLRWRILKSNPTTPY